MCPGISNTIMLTDLTLARSNTLVSASYHRHAGGSRNTMKCYQVSFSWNALTILFTSLKLMVCLSKMAKPLQKLANTWRGSSAFPQHEDLLACPEQLAKPADTCSLPLLSFCHTIELNWPVLIAPLVKAFCLPIFDTCLLNGDNSTKSMLPALINSCLWSILKIQGDLPLLLLLL